MRLRRRKLTRAWRLEPSRSLFALILIAVFSTSCRRQSLTVMYVPTPDYPIAALSQGIDGVVIVTVGIKTDGKVLYATGSGASWLLVHAAEENAKGWAFQVPPRATFPLEHRIKYTFAFDKERSVNRSPTIVTDLPNSIEVIGGRIHGDTFGLVPSQPEKQ